LVRQNENESSRSWSFSTHGGRT